MSASLRTVLVVDDEADITSTVKAILEDEGYRVLTAADGQEALEVLQTQTPDVVLMDVMMPRLSGYEVLSRLHGQVPPRTAPVILMSAVNPRVKQSEFGWQHFLKKPFSLDELLAAVKRFS